MTAMSLSAKTSRQVFWSMAKVPPRSKSMNFWSRASRCEKSSSVFINILVSSGMACWGNDWFDLKCSLRLTSSEFRIWHIPRKSKPRSRKPAGWFLTSFRNWTIFKEMRFPRSVARLAVTRRELCSDMLDHELPLALNENQRFGLAQQI